MHRAPQGPILSLSKDEGRVCLALAPLAGGDLGAAPVEIFRALADQLVDLALEEVVGAGNDLLLDGDALLRLELVDQLLHRLRRRNPVFFAVDDETGGRAGGKKGKIV